jgi:ferrous iron transport protein B
MNFPQEIQEIKVLLHEPLFRGERRLRIALVGIRGSGRSTIFKAVSSTSVTSGELADSHRLFDECKVQIGLDEASVVDLPNIDTLINLPQDDLHTLKYLLWGDERPPVSDHEPGGPPAPFAQPDVIVQVMDASALGRHLELFLELSSLGKPMVVALNRMDEAGNKGLHINAKTLSKRLGVPVVPTVAHMGQGLAELFAAAVDAVRQGYCPLPQPANKHICECLQPLSKALVQPDIHKAFRVPHEFLLTQLAANDRFVLKELEQHFPDQFANLMHLRREAEQTLPRPLHDEIHADRHHRAASLREAVSRTGAPHEGRGWRYWLDELFLHPQWGLLGSMAVFAAVLFVVFEVSSWLDSVTAARLVDLVAPWQPQSTLGVVGRAVVDGIIGLIGIVVPYMIPLVLLLVALEETGIMQRIAFVVDRGFHQIGLHGGVAVPFLLGLGCNVPAISSVARSTHGRDRFIATLLITFVPCSARSAVILALAGKYLGGLGVFTIFVLTTIIIGLMGRLLKRRYKDSGPGQVQDIPPYSLPDWRSLFYHTWLRTRDILTIVTPLLVGGSVVLALLNHVGADEYINTFFIPVTSWWLGLPVVLGVPILFGILRKELSLLMIYQALGTFDVGSQLDWIQIMTFLIFLTFYIPCVSTFAVMLNTIGRKQAVVSISVSVAVALLISGVVRLMLEGVDLFISI